VQALLANIVKRIGIVTETQPAVQFCFYFRNMHVENQSLGECIVSSLGMNILLFFFCHILINSKLF
jgi:hypothetical protein